MTKLEIVKATAKVSALDSIEMGKKVKLTFHNGAILELSEQEYQSVKGLFAEDLKKFEAEDVKVIDDTLKEFSEKSAKPKKKK